MKNDKFLLISLNDSKTKELAQAVASETCRKILDYLSDNESTESELADKLNIPISTIHYNLQQLQKGGLVVAEEFHYSDKGKEVNHYKLANKYIIIAPKSTYGIKEKLRSILPAALIMMAGAVLIQIFSRMRSGVLTSSAKVFEAAPNSAILEETLTDSSLAAEIPPAVSNHISFISNIALWFFLGAASALIIYLIIEWIRTKKD